MRITTLCAFFSGLECCLGWKPMCCVRTYTLVPTWTPSPFLTTSVDFPLGKIAFLSEKDQTDLFKLAAARELAKHCPLWSRAPRLDRLGGDRPQGSKSPTAESLAGWRVSVDSDLWQYTQSPWFVTTTVRSPRVLVLWTCTVPFHCLLLLLPRKPQPQPAHEVWWPLLSVKHTEGAALC